KMFLDAEQRELDHIGSRLYPYGRAVTFYIPILLCIFTTFLCIVFVNSLYRLPLSRFGYRPEYRFEVLKLLFIFLGFKPSVLDSSRFVYMIDEFSILVYLYVDDFYIVTNAGTGYRQSQSAESPDRYRRKERLDVGCLCGGFAIKNLVDCLDMHGDSYAIWAGDTRMKNVAVKWRWMQNHDGDDFEVKHMRSLDMTADLLTKMPNFHVWSTLLSHLLGHEPRSSAEIIQAQERPKDTEFPSKGLGNP
ncbi:MAG: hypothetical protein HOI47_04810, partial [Candidatus Scalindua sp.]|nr:hypothetical protein [Candidatus Scalindua sp.]